MNHLNQMSVYSKEHFNPKCDFHTATIGLFFPVNFDNMPNCQIEY